MYGADMFNVMLLEVIFEEDLLFMELVEQTKRN